MSPQLVDLDADGHNDLVMGVFAGTAMLVRGSSDGFNKPEPILDNQGRPVVISEYMDEKVGTFIDIDCSPENEEHPTGQCTSVAAVDWDNDGDMDLLLGGYEGDLYLRKNEGTASKPVFASTNIRVKAGDGFLHVSGGMATPRLADWNKDGLFDLICGGVDGGVYYFQNRGTQGQPIFAAAKCWIEPIHKNNVKDEQPLNPESAIHVEVTDMSIAGCCH